jgi:hypothetical protein
MLKKNQNIEFIISDEPEIIIDNEEKNTLNIEETIKGNDKRKASCKKIGGEKKNIGHKREKEFLKQYNINELNSPIEYGAKSDTSIDVLHPICNILKEQLNVLGFNVSNKSGDNIQFTLGQIPELKDVELEELNSIFIHNLFNKYFKKSNSDKPADLLVYKDIEYNRWIFFNMDDIINFITTKCIWRKLDTGRIKGDFNDNSKKGMSQYITYEYRETHKSYFLGLNGGKGKKFIELLMNETYGIKYYGDSINIDI